MSNTDDSSRRLRIYPAEESDKGTYSCSHDKYKAPGVINAIVGIYTKGTSYLCELSHCQLDFVYSSIEGLYH
jgi:hypothetical protein